VWYVLSMNCRLNTIFLINWNTTQLFHSIKGAGDFIKGETDTNHDDILAPSGPIKGGVVGLIEE
jgi:hypothetical protein